MDLVASRKDPAVLVRLPGRVLAALDSVAKKNGRSRNSEVIFRLAQSLGISDVRTNKKV